MGVQGGGLYEGLGEVDEEPLPPTALVVQGPGVGAKHRMTVSQEDVWADERRGVGALPRPPPRALAEVPAWGDLYGEVEEVGGSVQLPAVV